MGWFKKAVKKARKAVKKIGNDIGDIAKDVGKKVSDPAGTLKYVGESFIKDPVGGLLVVAGGAGGAVNKAALNLLDRKAPKISALARGAVTAAATAATGGAFASFIPGLASAAGSTAGSLVGGVGGQSVGQLAQKAAQAAAGKALDQAKESALDRAREAILGKSAGKSAPVAFPSEGARMQALEAIIGAAALSPASPAERAAFIRDMQAMQRVPGWYDVPEIRRRMEALGLSLDGSPVPVSDPGAPAMVEPSPFPPLAWAVAGGGVLLVLLVLLLPRRR